MAYFNIPNKKKTGVVRSKAMGNAAAQVLGGYGITQPTQFSIGGSGFETAFDNILPKDQMGQNRLYRRIYQYDSVSGAAVDLMSLLPFSDMSLAGVEDKAVLQVFQDTMEHLNTQTLVPQLATEFLIIGKLVGTLVFNSEMGIFTDIITQDPDYCMTEPIPLQGYDPKVDLRVPPEFRSFLTSKDPRDEEARKELPEELKRKLLAGKIQLDPMTTLYLARKTFPKDTGTSYLSRVVPFFILEQLLLEGTIQGAQRRQRAIMHIQAGSDEWEPTATELEELIEMFISADLDPIGAVVATKRDVDVNDIRPGGDFWKVTDEWDSLTQAKMRSLGINEAFLCVKSSTYVSSSKGLVKIADIYPNWETLKKNEYVDIELPVKGFRGPVIANKFWYRGYGHTYQVTTEKGYNVDTTEDHRFLILGHELKPTWKRAKELSENDFIFIDTRGKNIRGDKLLKLNLETIEPHPNEDNQDPKKPTVMTTDLSYLIGLLLSDGEIGYNRRIALGNSNEAVINSFVETIEKVFGTHNYIRESERETAGDEYVINGIKGTRKENYYTASFKSSIVVDWMRQLGVRSKEMDHYNAKPGEKYAWRFEEIPWCIMQADRESQYAFLAGFIDGDGSVYKDGDIIIYRKNNDILNQFRVLLADMGIPSYSMPGYPGRMGIAKNHGARLFSYIGKYINHSYKVGMEQKDTGYHRTQGLPIEPLREFLQSRHMYRQNNVGEWFEDDMGDAVVIKGFAIRFARFLGNVVGENKQENGKLLLYSSYKEGKYEELIEEISKVSLSVGSRLRALLELEFKFDRFSHKIKMPKDHLFDLSISQEFSPAYVANAFVTHNTGDATYNCVFGDELLETKEMGKVPIGQLCDKNNGRYQDIDLTLKTINGWEQSRKWFYNGKAPTLIIKTASGKSITCTPKHRLYLKHDLMDFAANIKVGETILCQTESGIVYDDLVVEVSDGGMRDVFDIAMENGTSHTFMANGIVSSNTMEAALSVFIETLRAFRFFITQRIFYHKLFPILARVHRFVKRKQSELDHNIRITGSAKDIPLKDLIIPEVQWHKQLAPSYDESYFSILGSVQEQGLPIPLRVWAAAGGFSIEKLLDGLDDDLEVRKKLGEYKEKVKELPGAGEEGEEAGWGSVGRSELKHRKKDRALKVISNATRAANSDNARKEASKLLRLTGTKNLPASKIVVGDYS